MSKFKYLRSDAICNFYLYGFYFVLKDKDKAPYPLPIPISLQKTSILATQYTYEIKDGNSTRKKSTYELIPIIELLNGPEVIKSIKLFFSLFFGKVVSDVTTVMLNDSLFMRVITWPQTDFVNYYSKSFQIANRSNIIKGRSNNTSLTDSILCNVAEKITTTSYYNREYMMRGYFQNEIKLNDLQKAEGLDFMINDSILSKTLLKIDSVLIPEYLKEYTDDPEFKREACGFLMLPFLMQAIGIYNTLEFVEDSFVTLSEGIGYTYAVSVIDERTINVMTVPSSVFFERNMESKFFTFRDRPCLQDKDEYEDIHLIVELTKGYNDDDLTENMSSPEISLLVTNGIYIQSTDSNWTNLKDDTVFNVLNAECSPISAKPWSGFLSYPLIKYSESKQHSCGDGPLRFTYHICAIPLQIEENFLDACARKKEYKKSGHKDFIHRIFCPIKQYYSHAIYKSMVKNPKTKKYDYIAIVNTVYNNEELKKYGPTPTEVVMVKHSAYPHLQKINIFRWCSSLFLFADTDLI